MRQFALSIAFSVMLAVPAQGYRMIQNTQVGTFTFGDPVSCNAAGGFAHWEIRNIVWRINPALEGSTAAASVDQALNEWNDVAGSDYELTRGVRAGTNFAADGMNSILWANGNGCTGANCLALTALTLQAGQVITEADITFNTNVNWTTSIAQYNIRAVAAHELGHSLGIHHSEVTSNNNRPTMTSGYKYSWRTIESDDEDALLCSVGNYPVNCTNPCPAGGVYDGGNCYMWSVPGNAPFIANGNFYYGAVWHPNGPCPHPVLDLMNNVAIQPTFDGNACVIASTNGGPNPFIWNNNYYLDASPGPNRCPFGGTFDSQHCYLFTWPGVSPSVFNENMYYEAVNHPAGPCPHPAFNNWTGASVTPWFDNVRCVVDLGPNGNQLPFLWDNNYYLSPVCRP